MAENQVSGSGATITVGCKLPHGIHLDLFDANGNRSGRVTLKGNNSSRVVGGFGITEGVPREHFDKWIAQNKSHAAVRNGLIFAHGQAASVESFAREHALAKSGLEPMDPSAPSRGVAPADDADGSSPQKAAMNIDKSVAPYHPKPGPAMGIQ